jgi:uridine kinase
MFENLGERIKNNFYEKNGVFKVGFLNSRIFWSVLAIKVATSWFLASDFLAKLFVPFVNYFVLSGFNDPYHFFYQQKILNIFPYPDLMLWFLAVPRFIFYPFLSSDIFAVSHAHIFLMRLPIILADGLIFLILYRWLKNKQDKVLWYYWCSPILFYINYIHGQLDALPMALLFVFLYFLFKEKWRTAFIFLGLSLSAKTSIAIILPFVLVYLLLKRFSWHKILVYMAVPIFIFLVLNFRYIATPAFIEIVFKTKEELKVLNLSWKITDQLIIYFVPLAYLILFVKSLIYRTFNRDIFLMFLGFSFGILTLLIPPMQGWYYWIVPFFVYFYIKQENAPKFIFVFLNIFYFLYFFLIRDSDIFSVWKLSSIFLSSLTAPYYWFAKIGLNPDYLVNISFTLLQGSLFLNILWIYRKGIESLIKNKINYQPYLIAVAGDSGSGKSTLTDLISAKFGQENTLVVAGDDAHRWERGDSNWSKFTHLDPRANKLHDELEQIVDLRAGRSVQRSFYDHSTGKFTVPVKLHSKKIIVFQGLHSLFLNKMRDFYDLKIYIKPSEALRLYWKVQRDMKERGYDAKKVLEQIKQRASDSEKYINPQDAYADIIVSFNTEQPIVDYSKEIDELGLYLKIIFENNINILPLLTELDNVGSLKVNHYYDEDKQILEIRGEADVIDIDRIAYKLIPELWEVVKDDPHWSTGYNGLIQLFVGYYIFQKMRLEHRYEY